ncbi:Lrp/AsnC family transcriptional regulator [candidate division KSB1 bacterium]
MVGILDDKDKKILAILKEDSSLSTQQISKKTLIPITTVHNRIKKLREEGIIKGYTVVLDHKKMGRQIAAYILLTVDYNLLKKLNISQHNLAKKIRQNPNVEEVTMVTGGTDILIKVRVADVEALDEFVTKYLRNVDGVERTQTMVILSEF